MSDADNGYQLLANILPDYTGPVDFITEADKFATKRDLHITAVSHATNGDRGDSILSDISNTTNAAFVAPLFVTIEADDRGSMQGITSVVILDERADTAGVYAEAGALLGQVHASRTGAYLAAAELGVIINDGFPARANGLSVGVIEYNTLGDYDASGMSASWRDTGSRHIWLWNLASGGPPIQPPGVGILLEGDYQRAGIYFRPIDAGGYILIADQIGSTAPWFAINGLGTIQWSALDGSSSAQLAHAGVNDQLTLGGRLDVTDVLQALSDLNVNGDITGSGGINVTGDGSITGAFQVGGTVTLGAATSLNTVGSVAVGGALFAAVTSFFNGAVTCNDNLNLVQRIQLLSAALVGTAATAGTNGAPPATVQGYLLMTSPTGTTMRIPYYNT